MKRSWYVGVLGLSVLICGRLYAGGGGHNMVVMLNPDDENSLRVANAYHKLRDIPENHFMFTSINAANKGFVPVWGLNNNSRSIELAQSVVQFIAARGLSGQIDYIASLGQPPATGYDRPTGGWFGRSLTCDLMHADEIAAGAHPFDFHLQTSPLFDPSLSSYVLGGNTAIEHSQTGCYVAGLIAWTGQFGNSASDVIASLQRSVEADGARPAGTIYFEDNDDIRSVIRRDGWSIAAPKLASRGIATLYEYNTPGWTPKDRPDVLGAVVGHAFPVLSNGSTYIGGSWADHVTSVGGSFSTRSQRKCTEFIRSGATATSGTVSEPTANSYRFPHPMIYVYIADGSTMGEAFAKAVKVPDLLNFIGDPLAQPFADLPTITINSGPAEGATVSGTIQLNVAATLNSPRLASGILKMQLCIDGKLQPTELPGGSGQFVINTTTLSDGWHELRVVAINNAAARSQSHVIRWIVVSNWGRQVTAGGDLCAAHDAIVPVSVTATGGVVNWVELRHLGRTLGQINGASGVISLDCRKLAYGGNPIVPVAIFSDGMVVRGRSFTLTRLTPPLMPAQPPTPPEQRRYGINTEYFIGKGKSQIEDVDFSAEPDKVVLHSRIGLGVPSDTLLADQNIDRELEPLEVSAIDGLALRFTGRFIAEQSGQYEFFPHVTCDSYRLIIDDQVVMTLTGTPSNPSCSVFLEAGEHTFTYLTTNTGTGRYDSVLHMRGPDGVFRQIDNTFAYVVGGGTEISQLEADDFESRAAGTAIKNYNPPWSALVSGGNNVRVIDTHPVPRGGTKILHFPYSSSSSSQEIVLFRYTGTRVVSYEFDIYVASRTPFDSALWQARMHPVYGTGSQAEVYFKFVQSSAGAKTWNIQVIGAGGLAHTVATGLPMDQWHHLILGVDLVDVEVAEGNTIGGRYWVYVNGEPKAEGVAYSLANQLSGSIADTSYAYIHNGVGDARPHLDMYLDNLVVWDGIQTPPMPEVVGRYVFYNRSAWDSHDPSANPNDDQAIATDKTALLPGGVASFANYTSYNRGLNGIMVDIANLPGTVTANDFSFKIGNSSTPSSWPAAPPPQSVTVRPGAGINGSDRVTIIWADNAIQKTWLQVTVLANANTGLSENDVFYFGNAIGESGDSSTHAWVNSTDEIRTRQNPHTPSNLAAIDDVYDFNRDRLVNSSDQLLPRMNATTPSTALKLITVP